MQDEYRQILEEEKHQCCGGHPHEAFHKMRDGAMSAAKEAKTKYEKMDQKQKNQFWAFVAGAVTLLLGILTLSKMKGKKKED
jgi:hypothetical protein